jgi:hypothetical protein
MILSVMFLSACASAIQASDVTGPSQAGVEEVESPAQITETLVVPSSTPLPIQKESQVAATHTPEDDPEPTSTPYLDDLPPRGAVNEFKTDFSKHSISYAEVLSGGPPKDGIPAIDEPQYATVAEADAWLEDLEPVISIQVGDEARAYPIQILMWHEIVNDVLADEAIAVTFCPLCNTGIAFKRTVDDTLLDFGTTGRLRFSNLIMYDRQTETWWQQATGEAVAGEFTGRQLEFYPAAMISWEEFKSNYPDGSVLSRDTGYSRDYGRNPYTGYDNVNALPFLFDGPETPDELPAMARVLTVDLESETVAYPFSILEEVHLVNDTVAGQDVVVFWEAGTASALDASQVAAGKDVGSANAFSREVDGQVLTFRFDGGRILDEETGSEWDALGQSSSGSFSGTQLELVVSINHFWFSWAAFKPETRIYQP